MWLDPPSADLFKTQIKNDSLSKKTRSCHSQFPGLNLIEDEWDELKTEHQHLEKFWRNKIIMKIPPTLIFFILTKHWIKKKNNNESSKIEIWKKVDLFSQHSLLIFTKGVNIFVSNYISFFHISSPWYKNNFITNMLIKGQRLQVTALIYELVSLLSIIIFCF